MPKWIISLFIGLLLLTATIITVTGQSPLVRFASFVVDIQQQVPVEVALTIPMDNGDITTTVPLTLGINLQINVTGPHSATVATLGDTSPDIRVTTSSPDRTQTDDLDISYQLLAIDDNLELTEWTVYQDSNEFVSFAGELRNTSTNQRFSNANLVVRLYRADDTVLSIESITASGRWVDPDQTIRFKNTTAADLSQIDHYKIEIAVQDWTDVP